ncbi:hypothetical protein [Mycobacterium intracellulare]|uniref:hypothetical protein n=1 Tax=Mycobacterium intracellulare TaxID=1767 RepID=UPI001EED11C4|nr:hypothetical protein [Mycobacterium intracellulare]MEE3755272.1 hypothetical protein [Mycobacterium intracellulare]
MSPEGFNIPRIQLPQIGQPDPPSPSREEEGSVREADDHFERFARFIDGGEGLDRLIDGVQRDTVGSDGRTPDQREAEAEQAHHESVAQRNAVSAPKTSRRTKGFFDDDDEADELFDVAPHAASAEHHTLAPRVDPPPRQGTDPLPHVPARYVPDDEEAGADDEYPDPGDPYDPGEDDSDDEPTHPPHDVPGGDGAIPPPGSLWESTHSSSSDPYDPGMIVVDPPSPRAEPGAISRWIQIQYERRWVPLRLLHKGIAVGVVAALALWAGYLMFGSGKAAAPQSQAADPIVDTAAPHAGPTSGPLPPDDVKAPACASRSRPPANAFSGKPEDAWVCARAFNTDLQTIIITYAKPVVVCSIFVIPGFEHTDNNGRGEWNEHRIVTLINWRVGGQAFSQTIDPNAHTGATVQIPCVATQVITGTIFKTVPPPPAEGDNGPSDEDVNSTFAVKTITINGYPAGGAPR